MKNWPLFLLVLLFMGQVSAQQTLLEVPLGWRKNVEIHTISDGTKQRNCLFVMNSDSIRVLVLDKTMTVTRQFNLERLSSEQFWGAFLKDSKIYAFLREDKGSAPLHTCVLDIASGETEYKDVLFDTKGDREVKSLSCADHLLYLTVNKKTSEFTIYNFRDEEHYDSSHYQPEDSLWTDLTVPDGFSRQVNVAVPEQDRRSRASTEGIRNKLYLAGDTLYLLMNGRARGQTYIFSLDMAHKKLDSRLIVHNERSYQTPPLLHYEDNTFLLDGKLYFVSAIKDSLCVQIRDFYSGQLLHQYDAGKKDEITFKNSPIVYASSYTKFSRKEWTKTSDLLNEMVGGSAVIVARRDDSNRVVVSVGSHRELGGGGGMMVGGGGSFGAAPHFVPGGSGGTSSAGFRMLLDGNSLEHLSGDMGPTLEEKIDHYKEESNANVVSECLFESNGKSVYAYYNKDGRKLVVVGF